MERAEPAFKPEWLKSSSNGNNTNHVNNNHHVGTSPHSDEHGSLGVSSRNKLSSTRRTSSSNFSKNQESDSRFSKSKAYSSFGSCRRERDRVRDYELQRERPKYPSVLDNGFGNKHSSVLDNKHPSVLDNKNPSVLANGFNTRFGDKKNPSVLDNGFNTRFGDNKNPLVLDNGFNTDNPLRRTRSTTNGGILSRSFEKEFPSLGEKPSINNNINTVLQNIPLSGVETWNSVLVDVPNNTNTNNVVVNGNGSSGSNGSSLNMAETVAQAPFRVRTPPQLTIDTQKIEERTLKQFKQLIPVTPSMPKSSVSVGSLDKMKNKTIQPVSSPKPTQIGNFQVLNRDKTVISPSVPTVLAGPTVVASAVPQRSPTRRAHSQSRDKLEFFQFIRNQSLGATSAAPDQDKDKERSAVGADELVDVDPDPEEEAFLKSLGWDQNAEVDALTQEEIESFINKYKEVKPCSKLRP